MQQFGHAPQFFVCTGMDHTASRVQDRQLGPGQKFGRLLDLPWRGNDRSRDAVLLR